MIRYLLSTPQVSPAGDCMTVSSKLSIRQGSTAFPKPIVFTHERLLLSCLAPCKFYASSETMTLKVSIGFGQRDLTGQRLACHAMPMFHGMGVMQIGWTVCGKIVPNSARWA